jgi:hypothetical protein
VRDGGNETFAELPVRDDQYADHVSGAGPPQATDYAPLGAASEASVGVVSS